MPSWSFQLEQEMVNKVVVFPVKGLIEQVPFSGGLLIVKSIALELIWDGNE